MSNTQHTLSEKDIDAWYTLKTSGFRPKAIEVVFKAFGKEITYNQQHGLQKKFK